MSIGNPEDLIGNVHPSSVEKATLEAALWATRITEIPSNMQMKLDYTTRTDGQPVYIGYAPRGLTDAETGWLLQKFTYTADPGNMTVRQIAYSSWDLRADGDTVYA